MTRKCGSATTPVDGYARPPALFAERAKCDLVFQTVRVHLQYAIGLQETRSSCSFNNIDIRHNKRQHDKRFIFFPSEGCLQISSFLLP